MATSVGNGTGLISQTLNWITHPQYADANPADWAAGLVLVLILSFGWITILKSIE